MELVKEAFSRAIQIIFGIFIFDCPGLINIRNFIINFLFKCNGKKMVIAGKVLFYAPHGIKKAKLEIGRFVRLSENIQIDCSSNVTIGDNVWISQNVQIFNHIHNIRGINWKESGDIELTEGIVIEEDAWIGADVIILPKVKKIGRGAIIGAGSIVTQDIEDYAIVAGNPAKKIGNRL